MHSDEADRGIPRSQRVQQVFEGYAGASQERVLQAHASAGTDSAFCGRNVAEVWVTRNRRVDYHVRTFELEVLAKNNASEKLIKIDLRNNQDQLKDIISLM